MDDQVESMEVAVGGADGLVRVGDAAGAVAVEEVVGTVRLGTARLGGQSAEVAVEDDCNDLLQVGVGAQSESGQRYHDHSSWGMVEVDHNYRLRDRGVAVA